MEDEGITFVCNTEIGKDIAAEQLKEDFDTHGYTLYDLSAR